MLLLAEGFLQVFDLKVELKDFPLVSKRTDVHSEHYNDSLHKHDGDIIFVSYCILILQLIT